MSEADLRATFKREMNTYGWPVRIEDACSKGVPDTHYVYRWQQTTRTCWIEFKYLDAWPKRKDTTVKIKSFKRNQILWLEKYDGWGGNAWVLLQVGGREWALFGAKAARELFEGRLTRAGVLAQATVHSEGEFPKIDLLRVLG